MSAAELQRLGARLERAQAEEEAAREQIRRGRRRQLKAGAEVRTLRAELKRLGCYADPVGA